MADTLDVDVHELSSDESQELLDGMAQHYLGITAEEFRTAWEAGEYDDDPNRSVIMRLAILLPSQNGRRNGNL